MKKLAFLMAALAIVGCSQQGGTDDPYNTDAGGSRSGTATTTNDTYNVSPDRSSTTTDTNSNLMNTSTNTPPLPPQQ